MLTCLNVPNIWFLLYGSLVCFWIYSSCSAFRNAPFGRKRPRKITPRFRGLKWYAGNRLPWDILTPASRTTYPLVNIHKLWKDPPFLIGKSTISMTIFNSKLLVYQRVLNMNGCVVSKCCKHLSFYCCFCFRPKGWTVVIIRWAH